MASKIHSKFIAERVLLFHAGNGGRAEAHRKASAVSIQESRLATARRSSGVSTPDVSMGERPTWME